MNKDFNRTIVVLQKYIKASVTIFFGPIFPCHCSMGLLYEAAKDKEQRGEENEPVGCSQPPHPPQRWFIAENWPVSSWPSCRSSTEYCQSCTEYYQSCHSSTEYCQEGLKGNERLLTLEKRTTTTNMLISSVLWFCKGRWNLSRNFLFKIIWHGLMGSLNITYIYKLKFQSLGKVY